MNNTTETKHTPAMLQSSRIPWRAIRGNDGCWEVWTRADDTPGSQNNYVVAGEIQSGDEARMIACAPELVEALQSLEQIWSMWDADDRNGFASLSRQINDAMPQVRAVLAAIKEGK